MGLLLKILLNFGLESSCCSLFSPFAAIFNTWLNVKVRNLCDSELYNRLDISGNWDIGPAEFGLIGLFEKPRSGRPATPQEEAQLIGLILEAKFRKEELNVQYLAQGSKQSNDVVWRETRIRNLIN